MKLTYEYLQNIGACDAALRQFKTQCPDGIEVTSEAAAALWECNQGWWVWLLGSEVEICKALIEAGVDVNAEEGNIGWTALHCAANAGNTETARALIEAGADVNAKDDGGWTALHCAAKSRYTETARALVEAGADVNAKDAAAGCAPEGEEEKKNVS